MGVGALGGYVGAHMAKAGEDVAFIDPWPEHVEQMRTAGLRISHLREVPEFHRQGARIPSDRRAATHQGAADRRRLRLC